MYLDLTVIAGAKDYVEIQPSRTELFRLEIRILFFLFYFFYLFIFLI